MGFPVRVATALLTMRSVRHRDKRALTAAQDDQDLIAYADRIQVRMLDKTPSSVVHQEAEEMVSGLINERDWSMLGELLSEWDRSRAACPSNRRLVYTAVDCMTVALRSHQTGRANLAVAADCDADLFTLRSALAQIYIANAWDGMNRQPELSHPHIDRALALVADLDAKERGSPIVGAVHFNLLPLLGAPYDQIVKAYETRVHLDADDLAPHFALGRMIPVERPGRAEQIELCGRQAVSWTHKRFGAAAYAAIYLGEFQQCAQTLPALDVELLEEGLDDLITYRQRDPMCVAEAFQTLHAFATTDTRGTIASQQSEIGTLATDLLRKHLTAIFPDAWEFGEKGAMAAIARAMHADLKNDYDVVVDENGVCRQKKGA